MIAHITSPPPEDDSVPGNLWFIIWTHRDHGPGFILSSHRGSPPWDGSLPSIFEALCRSPVSAAVHLENGSFLHAPDDAPVFIMHCWPEDVIDLRDTTTGRTLRRMTGGGHEIPSVVEGIPWL